MKKYKNIYLIGVFDLFHRGHVELLKNCSLLGENLIVAINGDDLVTQYKRKPIYSETDRLEIIKACKYVSEAFIVHDYDNKPYVEQYKIDAIVHGDDWEKSSYLRQIAMTEDYLKAQNIKLILLPYTHGISSRDLIKKIKNS